MVNAVHCIFRRLRLKHGIDLGAHQLRRTWTTNFRRLGVGDPYDLQRERGWEDLETPHRFYVNSERDKPGRASIRAGQLGVPASQQQRDLRCCRQPPHVRSEPVKWMLPEMD